jgi:hypothetical protein
VTRRAVRRWRTRNNPAYYIDIGHLIICLITATAMKVNSVRTVATHTEDHYPVFNTAAMAMSYCRLHSHKRNPALTSPHGRA